MKIAHLNNYEIKSHLGGCELTVDTLIRHGEALGHRSRTFYLQNIDQWNPEDYDYHILHNIGMFAPEVLEKAMKTGKCVFYCHDSAYYHKLYEELFTKSKILFFMSPLHAKAMLGQFGDDLPHSLMPSIVDIEPFYEYYNKKRYDDIVYIGLLAEHKGLCNHIEWAEENGVVIPMYGKLASGLPYSDVANEKWIDYRGVLPYRNVPIIMGRTKRFIHMPEWVEASGRTVIEAYFAGCELITNDKVGILSYDWDWDDPEAVKTHLTMKPYEFYVTLEENL